MKQKLLLILVMAISQFVFAQTVVKVIDGDTYKILENGTLKTVRLINVDAPELNQLFGKQVKDSITKLLLHQTVTIKFYDKDLYKRIKVHIKIKGMSLDSLLIVKGLAWFYTSYAINTSLKICEGEAKLKGLGIWTCAHPVPP